MSEIQLTEFELRLLKVAVKIVIDDEMSFVFRDDFIQLYDKLLNACTKETE